MLLGQAAEFLDVTMKQMRLYKNVICPSHMYFERGNVAAAPAPYNKHEFVYISPPGTICIGQSQWTLDLIQWTRMCSHLTDDLNNPSFPTKSVTSCAKEDKALFVAYTGLPATPSNIKRALDEKVLITSKQLANATPNQGGRPKKNENNNNNNNRSNNNQAAPLATTNKKQKSVLPSTADLTKELVKRLRKVKAENVVSDAALTEIAGVMRLKKITAITYLGNDKKTTMAFTPCQSCESHRVCKMVKNLSPNCRECQRRIAKEKQHKRKREENREGRLELDGPVNITRRTPEELKEWGKKNKRERDRRAKVLKRAITKMKTQDELLRNMSPEMKTNVAKSFNYANQNPKIVRDKVSQILKEIIQEENISIGSNVVLSDADCKPIIDMIIDEIKNQCLAFNNQKRQSKYSSRMVGLAMSLYLQSGPTAYEQFRKDSIMIYPSSSYLKSLKYAQDTTDGKSTAQYEDQLKLRKGKEEIGQVIVDEMKLKKDVIINVKSGAVVGVTDDFICQKKLMKNWLDNDKPDEMVEAATHVNQWQYRSTDGRVFNCEFFYNSGSLSGNALLEQFTRVVMNCELVGSKVFGLLCDAGGNNARLMNLLRQSGAGFPNMAWVGEDDVTTANPFDPSRRIYLFHCATHDVKNMRNAFYTPKKEFLDVNGNRISKRVLEECYLRDLDRVRRNTKPMTKMQKSTIHLDRWSKMNVQEAKRICDDDVLAEIADDTYCRLGFPTIDGRLLEQDHGRVGYYPAVARHMKQRLAEKRSSGSITKEDADVLASTISSLEWLANLNDIFTNRLMNMKMPIHSGNIDR